MVFGRPAPADVTSNDYAPDVDFDALADCISDGIAVVGVEGLVSAWSNGAAAITGIARVDAVGKSLDKLFTRIEPPLGLAVVPEPIELLGSDERRRVLHATALSIDDGWLLSFGREVRYPAIEQLKDEIVAAVSHELKTPIATIKAYATTLRANPDAVAEGDRQEFLSYDRRTSGSIGPRGRGSVPRRPRKGEAFARSEQLRARPAVDATAERLVRPPRERLERICSTAVMLYGDPDLLADALLHLVENARSFRRRFRLGRGRRCGRG